MDRRFTREQIRKQSGARKVRLGESFPGRRPRSARCRPSSRPPRSQGARPGEPVWRSSQRTGERGPGSARRSGRWRRCALLEALCAPDAHALPDPLDPVAGASAAHADRRGGLAERRAPSPGADADTRPPPNLACVGGPRGGRGRAADHLMRVALACGAAPIPAEPFRRKASRGGGGQASPSRGRRGRARLRSTQREARPPGLAGPQRTGTGLPFSTRPRLEARRALRRPTLTMAGIMPGVTVGLVALRRASSGRRRQGAPERSSMTRRPGGPRASGSPTPAVARLERPRTPTARRVCGFLKGLSTIEREAAGPARAGKIALALALKRLAKHLRPRRGRRRARPRARRYWPLWRPAAGLRRPLQARGGFAGEDRVACGCASTMAAPRRFAALRRQGLAQAEPVEDRDFASGLRDLRGVLARRGADSELRRGGCTNVVRPRSPRKSSTGRPVGPGCASPARPGWRIRCTLVGLACALSFSGKLGHHPPDLDHVSGSALPVVEEPRFATISSNDGSMEPNPARARRGSRVYLAFAGGRGQILCEVLFLRHNFCAILVEIRQRSIAEGGDAK